MEQQIEQASTDREQAYRVFASELRASEETLQREEDEDADDDTNPANLLLLPSGAGVNRLFIVGAVTEVNEKEEHVTARVAGPTGAYSVVAGQYQPPEVLTRIENLEPPEYVAVTGKPDTFEDEDEEELIVTVRPEELNIVGEQDRDRWVEETIEATEQRLEEDQEFEDLAEDAYAGVDEVRAALDEAEEEFDG